MPENVAVGTLHPELNPVITSCAADTFSGVGVSSALLLAGMLSLYRRNLTRFSYKNRVAKMRMLWYARDMKCTLPNRPGATKGLHQVSYGGSEHFIRVGFHTLRLTIEH
jgi:hypothetical protein